jgi:hypothetical protein
MNRIDESQNSTSALELLAAQRCLYSQTKQILFGRGLLALSIAIAFPIIGAAYPTYGFYLALWASGYFLVDFVFLRSAEWNKKTLAAKIQEQFDTDVLGIRWNQIVAGEKADPEEVSKYSGKIFQKEVANLRNWYPPKVSSLPEGLAKTICQRANVRWDSKLRRCYSYLLLALLMILTIFMILSVKDKTVAEAFVLAAPFVPLLKILFEQFSSHRQSADRLEKLKSYLNEAIDSMMAEPSRVIPESLTRSIQDEIFRHRSSNTPVPNIFYQILKKRYEDEMNFSVDKFIESRLSAINSRLQDSWRSKPRYLTQVVRHEKRLVSANLFSLR